MVSISVDKELDTLWLIGEFKAELPVRLHKWLHSLGLYVLLNRGKGWSSLQAGGKYRSYLDARCEEEDGWEIRKFDREGWNRRFAAVVQPTYEIADFVTNCEVAYGDLEGRNASLLAEVIEHYKSTGQWLGLSTCYKNGNQEFGSHLDSCESELSSLAGLDATGADDISTTIANTLTTTYHSRGGTRRISSPVKVVRFGNSSLLHLRIRRCFSRVRRALGTSEKSGEANSILSGGDSGRNTKEIPVLRTSNSSQDKSSETVKAGPRND